MDSRYLFPDVIFIDLGKELPYEDFASILIDSAKDLGLKTKLESSEEGKINIILKKSFNRRVSSISFYRKSHINRDPHSFSIEDCPQINDYLNLVRQKAEGYKPK